MASYGSAPPNYAYYPEPFASGRTRARLAIGFLALGIVLHIVGIVSTFLQIDLLYQAAAGVRITTAAARSNDDRQQLIAVLQLLAYIATVVFFLIWIYRAYSNLKPLGVQNPEHSPGWAVGYFFIPFINLVRPYQIVQELWRESDPETLDNAMNQPSYGFVESSSNSALIGFWWAVWLFSNVAGWIAFSMMRSARAMDQFIGASWVSMVSHCLNVIAAILCTVVIMRIDRMQEEKNQRLQMMVAPPNYYAPPPPNYYGQPPV